jgi:hypothetical protein
MCFGEGAEMTMLTITAWKKKLVWVAAILAAVGVLIVLLLFGFGSGAQEAQGPRPEDLQEDVLRQPMRVQGDPADPETSVF